MKNHILHDFRISAPFKEISPYHSEDIYKLKLPKNFEVNLTSFLEGVMNERFDT